MTSDIPTRHFETDVLIVGGGAAATMAAFECADAGVRVIQATKGRATSGTTTVARGGFAAAMGKDDSPEQHLAELLEHGGELIELDAHINDAEFADACVAEFLTMTNR